MDVFDLRKHVIQEYADYIFAGAERTPMAAAPPTPPREPCSITDVAPGAAMPHRHRGSRSARRSSPTRNIRVAAGTPPWYLPGVTYLGFRRRLAERLLALRRAAGLTQEQVAAKAGITRQHLQRLESGKNDPKLGTVYKLARAFRISIGDLVGEAP